MRQLNAVLAALVAQNKLPAQASFRPLAEGGCPLVKK